MRGLPVRMVAMNWSSLGSDISNAGSNCVRRSLSRQCLMRSCLPNSIGEPQTTISGSPMSTPHQRVARHLAATSWLTRLLPTKKIRGSPEDPPVLSRARPCAWPCLNASVLARMSDLVRNGRRCRSAVLWMPVGSKPV